MSNSNKYRDFFYKELLEICPRVFYRKARSTTPYPYLTYDLTFKKINEENIINLEIRVQDDNDKTDEINNLADKVEGIFSNSYCSTDEFKLESDIESRNNIDEPDKTINTIRLTFNIEIK